MDMHNACRENSSRLTKAQKRTIQEGYAEVQRGEFVDARMALEEIRVAHGFERHGVDDGSPEHSEREDSGKLSEEMKRTILDGHSESLRGDGVDAETALEKIRAAHGF